VLRVKASFGWLNPFAVVLRCSSWPSHNCSGGIRSLCSFGMNRNSQEASFPHVKWPTQWRGGILGVSATAWE